MKMLPFFRTLSRKVPKSIIPIVLFLVIVTEPLTGKENSQVALNRKGILIVLVTVEPKGFVVVYVPVIISTSSVREAVV